MQRGDGAIPARAEREARPPSSIRELQRRRRDAARARAGIEAVLAQPNEVEAEAAEGAPAGAAPPRVYVVFHGTRWEDASAGLRESDAIAGIYATEEGARRAVDRLNRAASERTAGGERIEHDAWYQPYTVEE
jgi:hypothetical protein